ncbi:uncharacterized protein BO80DRAFT_21792 [Aspergillus ibericus CBS 121593]|uniref:Uncharacterized protein n=1 Tax=Aspergillus ibericus CBS 121593 TaxID=1448316 RepID=A0A395H9M6_9EURO|nr:hypothetical protein BO80DRAFT_21792 [Aspergillus ibericus CBS 121593]RAL02934.1 hypothetical protein BO80DRAFT_21792 [Aspergillus ibericus CBS 121593]
MVLKDTTEKASRNHSRNNQKVLRSRPLFDTSEVLDQNSVRRTAVDRQLTLGNVRHELSRYARLMLYGIDADGEGNLDRFLWLESLLGPLSFSAVWPKLCCRVLQARGMEAVAIVLVALRQSITTGRARWPNHRAGASRQFMGRLLVKQQSDGIG